MDAGKLKFSSYVQTSAIYKQNVSISLRLSDSVCNVREVIILEHGRYISALENI